MQVILLKDVLNVGKKYDVKNVSNGFAHNFLFPRKMAGIATPQSIKALEVKRKQIEQEKELQKDILEKNIESLNGLKIELKEKTNEKGHLFAAVHKEEISKILKEQKHLDIPVGLIEMDKPIKETGEHKIKINGKELLLVITGDEL